MIMAMKALVLLVYLTSGIDGTFVHVVQQAETSCSANFCNPNWTPFENMVYALRGYDLLQGNPMAKYFDPGFKNQIFVPTVLDETSKKYSLAPGITANDLESCQRQMVSNSFSNFKSYSDYVAKSARSGMNLQIGVEREVSVGVNIKGVEASSSATIPPPFTRGWSNSKNTGKLRSFFSEKQGMVSTTIGTCLSYEIRLERFHYPPFTTGFKDALGELYRAGSQSKNDQEFTFRKFIHEYGTHFLIDSILGAEFIHETRYSGNVRQNFKVDTLEACNAVSGSKVFGIQVEKDSSKCTSSDKKNLGRMSADDVTENIITRGSRPTDIKDWAKQNFKPVPIQFTLAPIINLFTDSILWRNDIKVDGKRIMTSSMIRKWFLPMYWNYCKLMGVKCRPKAGCGIDDRCPLDAICVGNGPHQCTQWSGWVCESRCSTTERRTRQCNGCKGDTKQIRSTKACKPASCFPDKKLVIPGIWGHWTFWDSCPRGSYVVRFQTKVESPIGRGDDTALNGIQMTCNDMSNKKITSGVQKWGYWRRESRPCPGGFSRVVYKMEPRQGNGDDTAGNAIRLYCEETGSWYESGEGPWGHWSRSYDCPTGYRIAALLTQIEAPDGDDTAMNGVQLLCKYFGN